MVPTAKHDGRLSPTSAASVAIKRNEAVRAKEQARNVKDEAWLASIRRQKETLVQERASKAAVIDQAAALLQVDKEES